MTPLPRFPRHMAIGILLAVACTFAANHIAARVAFDHGTGLLLAGIEHRARMVQRFGELLVVQGHRKQRSQSGPQ